MQNSVYGILGVPQPFDRGFTLVTSPIVPPLALACIRLAFALYGTFFTLFRLIYEGVRYHTDGSFFSYFTTLTYIGLFSYFWASGVQSLAYALNVRRGSSGYPLQRWPRPLQFLHLLLHSTITTYPIVVTAVFWGLLSSPDTLATRYSAWTNISGHALNTVFAAVEIFVAGAAPAWGRGVSKRGLVLPWVHLPFLIIILSCYLALAYVTHATQHFYVYPFLDPVKQGAKLAAYIIGIAVGETIVFLVVRYVMVGRAYLCARFLSSRPYVPGDDDDSASTHSTKKEKREALDDWEEVGRPSNSGSRGIAV